MRGSLNSRNSAGPFVIVLLCAALFPGCGGSTKSVGGGSSPAPSLKEFLATQEPAFRPALFDTKYLPDEWVYLVYDLPYYKVRVGNYAEKEAANESVKKLVSLGYADAWVVPERILKNPPPPPPPVPAIPDSTGK
jgi:hypothetical protein